MLRVGGARHRGTELRSDILDHHDYDIGERAD